MSRKTHVTSAAAFPRTAPIPVLEPPVKTGNGKATFKTASAAANAAKDARDEARGHAVACENAKQLCMLTAEAMHRSYRRDFWWKIALLCMLVVNVVFVCLRT